jgi:hypothetical protein
VLSVIYSIGSSVFLPEGVKSVSFVFIECDLHHADASGRSVQSPCSSPPCSGWQPSLPPPI